LISYYIWRYSFLFGCIVSGAIARLNGFTNAGILATVASFCSSSSKSGSVFNGKYWLAKAVLGIDTSAKLNNRAIE
jgi:hypothetical protein